jgi:hypothetical protein
VSGQRSVVEHRQYLVRRRMQRRLQTTHCGEVSIRRLGFTDLHEPSTQRRCPHVRARFPNRGTCCARRPSVARIGAGRILVLYLLVSGWAGPARGAARCRPARFLQEHAWPQAIQSHFRQTTTHGHAKSAISCSGLGAPSVTPCRKDGRCLPRRRHGDRANTPPFVFADDGSPGRIRVSVRLTLRGPPRTVSAFSGISKSPPSHPQVTRCCADWTFELRPLSLSRAPVTGPGPGGAGPRRLTACTKSYESCTRSGPDER